MEKLLRDILWLLLIVVVIFMAALVGLGVRYAELVTGLYFERIAFFVVVFLGVLLVMELRNREREHYDWEVFFDTSIVVVQPDNKIKLYLSHENKKGEKKCKTCGGLIGIERINSAYWQQRGHLWSRKLPIYCMEKCIPYNK